MKGTVKRMKLTRTRDMMFRELKKEIRSTFCGQTVKIQNGGWQTAKSILFLWCEKALIGYSRTVRSCLYEGNGTG